MFPAGFSGNRSAMKRLFDIVASLGGLVVLGWLIVLLAVLVRRDSAGPGLFRQERVGRNGVPFTCLKLRTMRIDTVSAASHDTPASAVTALGARLRRWKLDELPQLWNVLKGEMSFVGPRPCLLIQRELIEERRRRGVLALRPGITGLAQVQGIDMRDPVRLAEIDARYGASRSFLGDLALILRTVAGGGQGDRVAS
ncbi:Sugar transferase involved in LPS biosynthesis (colanic, teichoic acid) [Aureimonas jatrophae]|uniref:Sugar transferase involved in LPS biosynthesis (Colanic, teichoic acid) n=2 Tax=Aureimonas jatrophae TaxID=1166073 RepID=A0A1H0KKW4_9HYPH|nr:Sugar transferase involved in LPS biosynthesis (colanic, teichoic acid) [Aureimonas jatrophae]